MENNSRIAKAQQLVDMGFPIRLCYCALEQTKDNQDAAVDWLVNQGITYTEKFYKVDWLGTDPNGN